MQRSTLATCLAALGAIVLAAPAQALIGRTYVSAFGSDSANCSHSTPCRGLQAAHNRTAPGGEIVVLDPAGYGGALTITKAISIVSDGILASINPPVGGAGITINAGAGDAISLRGLTIDGKGASSTQGIVFNSGGSLTIRDFVVRRNSIQGLLFQPTGPGKLTISDSVFESNGGSGISIFPSGSNDVKAILSRIEANNNATGVSLNSSNKSNGSVLVSVFDSVAAHNNGSGFLATSSTTRPARLTLMQSVSANNGTGLAASGSQAILRIGDSMVTDNLTGWLVSGGQVLSYGTNQVDGNGSADTITSKIPLD
jgi:hypothetical protein